MKNAVFLDYTYVFDPSDTWSHLFEFEETFAAYLKTIGFEAIKVKRSEGQQGRGMMIIQKVGMPVLAKEPQKVGRPMKTGNAIRALAPKRRIYKAEREFKKKR